MTHVVLAALAFQRQDALAARARAHHPHRIDAATSPVRRTRRQRPGIIVGRLAALVTRA